jgi:uncharacterized membrane protein YozB (DUF420 family)
MDPRFQPGILGTNASLLSDLTLLAYLLLIVPAMLVGFVFARRKMFVPHHKLMMTTIILVNWVLIGYVMWFSYREAVAPNIPEGLSSPFNLLPTLHLITGGIAQILGTYLVIRMWFEKVLPEWVKVKRIKRYMRATLALWLVTAALGVALYLNWYVPTASAGGAEPAATEEADESEPDDVATPEPAATEEAGESEPDDAATPEPAATEEIAPAETEES